MKITVHRCHTICYTMDQTSSKVSPDGIAYKSARKGEREKERQRGREGENDIFLDCLFLFRFALMRPVSDTISHPNLKGKE